MLGRAWPRMRLTWATSSLRSMIRWLAKVWRRSCTRRRAWSSGLSAALSAALVAGPFVLFEPLEGVAVDVAAAERVAEDAAERDERAVDRLRRQALRAQLGDQAGDVVGRDLLQALVSEGGEEVFVEVVAVV